MSVSTPSLVCKWLLIAKRRPGLLPVDMSRGWRNTRPRPGRLYTIHTSPFSPAPPSLSPLVHFFVLSLFYEVVGWWSFWVRGGRIRRGAECAVHQTARPSLSPNDDITGARQTHTHAPTERNTHTHTRIHTPLVSPRLRLLVYQAAQVTHSGPDGVCHHGVWCLHESGCVCVFVCVCVCVRVCVCVWRQCVCVNVLVKWSMIYPVTPWSASLLWTHLWLN